MIKAKAFMTFIRIYSLFKSEHLSTNIKLTLHRVLIRSVMTCLPHLGICIRQTPLKVAEPAKQGALHHWEIAKVHIGL
jgi:hypothetical protein